MQKQVVDFEGEAVGALVPDNGRLRFMAVKYSVWSLDGTHFASLAAARSAVARILVSAGPRKASVLPPASIWVPQPGDPSETHFLWNASSHLGDGEDRSSVA